ncbi:hypothetical protein V1514DRAFT_323137 [Lipomyces japonicus]|uniref:uncharacterized protein n=1 Tax=Lipomyces japonicus TaxID=56871 RepID=UPI0034CE5099
MRKMLPNMFNKRIMQQLKSLYITVCYNYEPGDELFFFGFSKGATLVREIATFIADFGIFKKPAVTEFVNVFEMYASKGFEDSDLIQAWQAKFVQQSLLYLPDIIKIKVIGCFDTVGILGIPKLFPWQKHKYDLTSLRPVGNIEHVFHALSIDEDRNNFKPALWFFDQDHDPDKFQQVWFSGVHANIGGGKINHSVGKSNMLSTRVDHPNVLSDGCLVWMVSKCRHFLEFNFNYLHVNYISGHTCRDGEMLYPSISENSISRNQPVPMERLYPKQSVWYLGPIGNNFGGLTGRFRLLLGRSTRSLGKYQNLKKNTKERGFFKRNHVNLEGEYFTNEFVHMSVLQRIDVEGKRTRAMENIEVIINSGPHVPTSNSVLLLDFDDFELNFWEAQGQDLNRPEIVVGLYAEGQAPKTVRSPSDMAIQYERLLVL